MELVGRFAAAGPCIYGLKFDDSIYVGVTSNIYQRASAHLNALLSGKHSCRELQDRFAAGDPIDLVLIERLPEKVSKESARLQIETEWAVRLSENFKVISAHISVGNSNVRSISGKGYETKEVRAHLSEATMKVLENEKKREKKSTAKFKMMIKKRTPLERAIIYQLKKKGVKNPEKIVACYMPVRKSR